MIATPHKEAPIQTELKPFAFRILKGKKVFKNRESWIKTFADKFFGKTHSHSIEKARRVSQIAKHSLTHSNGLVYG